MSTPVIPPRPQRNQQGSTLAPNDTPSIPPRPTRKTDASPDREAFTRSPLNALPGVATSRPAPARSEADLPRRPPSVSLPGIGQEGSEYGNYDELPAEAQATTSLQKSVEADGQTKSVSADLPMHAPVASVPQSTATRQIETVTRTDSASAAAAGIGRHQPSDSPHQPPAGSDGAPLGRTTSNTAGGRRPPSVEPHPLRARSSFNRSTSSLVPGGRDRASRPPSVHGDHDHEYGIPEIGRQIPLYPNAGDVQAPSPATAQTAHAPGIGFFNDGSAAGGSGRNHTRKRSSRHEFGPPDSYGIRHDQDHQDQFERAWQAKHPEEAAKEEYHLHPPRPASALTSEQLNRLVNQTDASSGISRDATGTPDEEDVLDAAEEYNSRRSPLKAVPAQARSELGVDDNVVHVYPNSRRTSRISVGSADHAFDSAHHAASGYASDRDMPILAADEVIKRPSSAFMHAAVNPTDPTGDEPHESDYAAVGGERRSSSRPSSALGGALHRYTSHEEKHLEEIEEYDPLFPDDDDGKSRPKKVQGKKPDTAIMHHFPSRDVWEDTPDSLQYSAEVHEADIEREQQEGSGATAPSGAFETPEAERRRIEQNPDTMTSDNKTFIKPHFKIGSRESLHDRPGMPRFPSSDVWEDTPDSQRLETTVGGPQIDDERALATDEHSAARAAFSSDNSPRPERSSRLSQEVTPEALSDAAAARNAPVVEKSRPSVPARPVRHAQPQSSGEDAAAAPKAKPAVPARPSGEKFGNALRGKTDFLSDLNNRLKLGPQGPPSARSATTAEADADVAEDTSRAAPLADARKGRAKGPMRRKPAAATTTELKSASFALSPLITVWSIDEEDELQVDSDLPVSHTTTATTRSAGAPEGDVEADA